MRNVTTDFPPRRSSIDTVLASVYFALVRMDQVVMARDARGYGSIVGMNEFEKG